MKDIEKAREVKNQFKKEASCSLLKDYITGIGLSKDESGNYCIEVRLLSYLNLNLLITEYKGMEVKYRVTGEIKKML